MFLSQNKKKIHSPLKKMKMTMMNMKILIVNQLRKKRKIDVQKSLFNLQALYFNCTLILMMTIYLNVDLS